MRRITSGVLGLGAILALGALFAGGAQAHTFLWTGALPGLLLVLADGPQSFAFAPGGFSFICKRARFHGKVEKESQLTQKIVGQYTGCEAFGMSLSFSPVEYELSADELISVGKTIVIEIPTAGCKIEIPPGGNQSLTKARFLVDPNSGGTRLLSHIEVEKLSSTIVGGGGLCGEEGKHTEGILRGLLLARVNGAGALSWS